MPRGWSGWSSHLPRGCRRRALRHHARRRRRLWTGVAVRLHPPERRVTARPFCTEQWCAERESVRSRELVLLVATERREPTFGLVVHPEDLAARIRCARRPTEDERRSLVLGNPWGSRRCATVLVGRIWSSPPWDHPQLGKRRPGRQSTAPRLLRVHALGDRQQGPNNSGRARALCRPETGSGDDASSGDASRLRVRGKNQDDGGCASRHAQDPFRDIADRAPLEPADGCAEWQAAYSGGLSHQDGIARRCRRDRFPDPLAEGRPDNFAHVVRCSREALALPQRMTASASSIP